MKFTNALIIICVSLIQNATAQTMKAINLEPGDKLINQGVSISIDFTSEKKPWCGLRVDWGNGKSQPVRVGHDGDEGAPTSPIKLSNTYNTPGKYNISVKGELLVRGLTGTALPCETKANSAEVVVIDPVADGQFIQKAWTTYFASLESRPLQLQCVRIGIATLGIKNESAVAGDKLTSMETPVAKTLMERCAAFQQAKKPEMNGSCKIASGNNYFDSNCDGYYAEKQADGTLKSITIEDAITLQIQGKPWIVGLLETEAGKAARLTNEIAFKEKEKQRALETERQRAAELKAKKDAEEALLRMWKETGFAVSPLLPCPLNGKFHNCFGSGKDSSGNEYIGEFNNNVLVYKGIINYKNGDRYVGEYQGGLDGEGIIYYLAENEYKGRVFVGRYKKNVEAGNGIYFDRNGNVVESGLYEGNKLVEYRYVDPATFTRIPAGKIPVISADARLKIENKQAEIAKEQVEKQRVAALAKKEAAEKAEKAASTETSRALENLGIKRIAYCAASFTQASQFFTGTQKTQFKEKTDAAFSTSRTIVSKTSIDSVKAAEISSAWYLEKMDLYVKAIRSKYTKPDGGLDNAFLKLVEADYSECWSYLDSLNAKEDSVNTRREAAAICAAYHNYWFLIAYKSKNGNDMMFSDGVQKNIDNEYSGDKEYRDIRSKMFSQLSTINLGNPSQSEIQYVKSAAGFCVKAGFPIGQNTGR